MVLLVCKGGLEGGVEDEEDPRVVLALHQMTQCSVCCSNSILSGSLTPGCMLMWIEGGHFNVLKNQFGLRATGQGLAALAPG